MLIPTELLFSSQRLVHKILRLRLRITMRMRVEVGPCCETQHRLEVALLFGHVYLGEPIAQVSVGSNLISVTKLVIPSISRQLVPRPSHQLAVRGTYLQKETDLRDIWGCRCVIVDKITDAIQAAGQMRKRIGR